MAATAVERADRAENQLQREKSARVRTAKTIHAAGAGFGTRVVTRLVPQFVPQAAPLMLPVSAIGSGAALYQAMKGGKASGAWLGAGVVAAVPVFDAIIDFGLATVQKFQNK
jgi:ABC-type phosphate transport system substrate-binding protein